MADVSHTLATLGAGLSTTAETGGAVVLSSALPPIPAKVAAKIASGQFVAMKELLPDNMSLRHQLESFPAHQQLFLGSTKPRLREIDTPLTWVSCFLAYAAVRAGDIQTRNLLTYGRLVIRQAQRHSGPGWLEYDRIFRQHAALSPSTAWNELNPSLHASTVLSFRVGPGQVCTVCHEPDHSVHTCALQPLQPQPYPSSSAARPPFGPQSGPTASAGGPIRRAVRPETLERICVSWNRGRCSFPACKYCHVCAVCKQRGHRAKECQLDSTYKSAPGTSPKGSDGALQT